MRTLDAQRATLNEGRYFSVIESPVGQLLIVVDDEGRVVRCSFGDDVADDYVRDDARCREVVVQLNEYFERRRDRFELDLAPEGTDFQRRVWSALCEIPYGETTSYLHVAQKIGNPKAVRAVGRANGANPIAIIVPCHRVIGSSGSLVGYGGGMDVKEKLLALEQKQKLLF